MANVPEKENAAGFSTLNKAAMESLQGKYGDDVQFYSTNAALRAILSQIDRKVITGNVAAYDRGFDRTNPGYDKYYDRDRAALINPADLVTQPIEVTKQIRSSS
jgi:hypothetical protein